MYAKLRRILLVIGIVGATVTWFYVSLDPLVSVELTDFEERQRHEGDWSQSARILRPLPSDAVIMAKTGGAAIICAGETWISFAEDVIDATHGRFRDSSWTQRVDDSMFHRSPWSVRFYFRPWEHPLNEIADQLHRARGVEQYLQIEMGDQTAFLTVRYQNLESSDFQLGTGLALAPLPPRRFLNPLRPATIWLLLIGFAAYLLLPWKQRPDGAIYYPYARLIAGDLVSLMLFAMFFAVPFFVIGGLIQAFTTPVAILSVVLWPLAGIGLWLLFYMAECETLQIDVGHTTVEVESNGNRSKYDFNDIISWQPLLQQTPRSLIKFLWLGSMVGSVSSRLRSAGQAMILGETSAGGLGLSLKDGSTVFLWINEYMCSGAVKTGKRLLAALQSAGIPGSTDVRVVEALIAPDGEGPLFRFRHRVRDATLMICVATPVILMILGIILIVGRAVLFGSVITQYGS
jgi:hypothetical protein